MYVFGYVKQVYSNSFGKVSEISVEPISNLGGVSVLLLNDFSPEKMLMTELGSE